jgi:hypothetical protein
MLPTMSDASYVVYPRHSEPEGRNGTCLLPEGDAVLWNERPNVPVSGGVKESINGEEWMQ